MAELKPGDRVKFLNDVGIATVVTIIDKSQVLVKTENGFEYPYLKSELIFTDPLPDGKTVKETYSEKPLQQELSDKKLIILPSVESSTVGPLLLFLGFQPENVVLLLSFPFRPVRASERWRAGSACCRCDPASARPNLRSRHCPELQFYVCRLPGLGPCADRRGGVAHSPHN